MDYLLKELRLLNATLQRLADALVPLADPSDLDTFRAFRADTAHGRLLLRGIREPDPVRLRELKGIDDIIKALSGNTEQFLMGLPSNNALIYGPRGTGKSSLVKALLNKYGGRGLRMIEITPEALMHLYEVAEMVRGRKGHFILFCDDLSFHEKDQTYLRLKAVLEGGLEAKPRNMLVYATSNRRHLMPERMLDNLPETEGGEIHPSETVEERTSLSDRFGLRLGMSNFSLETYLGIVENYVSLRQIHADLKEVRKDAAQWSLSHGSFSGRTARQFVDDLEGRLKKRIKS